MDEETKTRFSGIEAAVETLARVLRATDPKAFEDAVEAVEDRGEGVEAIELALWLLGER
jgi:hypothetical protein